MRNRKTTGKGTRRIPSEMEENQSFYLLTLMAHQLLSLRHHVPVLLLQPFRGLPERRCDINLSIAHDRNHRPDTTSNHHLLFPSFSNWFGSFYSPCITNIYILLTITTYSFMTDPYQMFGATSSRLASSGMNFEWFVDWKQVKVKTIVMDRFGTDPAVAVPTWAAVRLVERGLHHLGGHQRRVQTDRSRRSGQTLGRTQIQTQHELRQTQPGFTVCKHPPCYQSHHVHT